MASRMCPLATYLFRNGVYLWRKTVFLGNKISFKPDPNRKYSSCNISINLTYIKPETDGWLTLCDVCWLLTSIQRRWQILNKIFIGLFVIYLVVCDCLNIKTNCSVQIHYHIPLLYSCMCVPHWDPPETFLKSRDD